MGQVIPSTAMQSETVSLVTAIFHSWKRAGIRFVILRNYKGLPDEIGNDLDILVDEHALKHAEKLLVEVARSLGYANHNRAEFAPISLYIYHPASQKQLHFDLFGSLEWRGFGILSPQTVLDQRVNNGLFSIPHPAHEAILNVLTRLLYNGYVKETYKKDIVSSFTRDTDTVFVSLEKTFGANLAQTLVSDVLTEKWSQLEAKGAQLRRTLIRRQLISTPTRTASALARDLKRFIGRAVQAPGLIVALIGPDGSGKSSVAEQLAERLGRTFSSEKNRYIHWKPSVLHPNSNRGGPPVNDPHGKPPRPRIISLAYFLFHLIDFMLGSQLYFRPVTFKNGLVIIDRYYYDFFIDQRRYRLKVPERLVRLSYRLVQQPDLVIYLDAPPEVLQARKQEVTFNETARQRQAYLALTGRLHNAYVVDASQPLDKVASTAAEIILGHMAKRTAQRRG